VPLRFPRPVVVTAAIGLVAAWAALSSVPAFADQTRQNEWWLNGLHVTQAQRATQGSGVTIALLDTGVDPSQADLSGSVISGPDCITNSTCGSTASTFSGIHGTAMASLIVGHGHGPGNSEGILGVAPAARLLSVQVALDSTSAQATDASVTAGLPDAIAAGIRYAVSAGAQVIDLPLDPGQSQSALVASSSSSSSSSSGTGTSAVTQAEQAAAGGSSAEQGAVAFALSKGVVLVAPAGDNGAGNDDPNFPAAYSGVISVGAFDSSFIKAPFTSRQSYVSLTAAGSNLPAATPSGYATVSSTSAASAIVTGIAGLIKSQYPGLTPAQVFQALTTSTVFGRQGDVKGSGHGTADAAAALAAAGKIAKSGPGRAGAGAVTRNMPATPPVPFVDQSLAPKIERDALISLAVLIVLLLPIGVYALMQRRRRQAKALARAEREQSGRGSRAPAVDSHADQMLEYFSKPAAQPLPTRGSRSSAARGSGSSAARGSGAGARGSAGRAGASASYPRSAGSFVGSGGTPAGREPSSFASPPRRAPLAPMSRASAARPPRVSGTPPWGPAAKPDTELPWATSPAPSAVGRRAPIQNLSAPPAESIWRQVGDGTQEAAAEGEQGGEDSDGNSRPIYVWNPSANTETFPSVPRDGNQGR
jgi:hypothetical protein